MTLLNLYAVDSRYPQKTLTSQGSPLSGYAIVAKYDSGWNMSLSTRLWLVGVYNTGQRSTIFTLDMVINTSCIGNGVLAAWRHYDVTRKAH